MSWERELKVLGEAIHQLNADYDAFLYGSVTVPPTRSRKNVEEMFRRLQAEQPDSSAERYQFSALQGRFYSLCERWERLQAEKEAGRRPGVHGGFVASLDAAAPSPEPAAPNAGRASSVEANRRAGPSPDQELFDRYVAAKRRLGEEVSGYRLEPFLERLREEREKLKGMGAFEVDFDVAERDGRVKLVARSRAGKRKP